MTLSEDLLDCRGAVLGCRGLVISAQSIASASERAVQMPSTSLAETFVVEDLHVPLTDPAYRHLFRAPSVQGAVARAILSVQLPPALFDELRAMKLADSGRYRHALCTAAVATRMMAAAGSEAPALPQIAAAALLHDIGMRHLPRHLARKSDVLDPPEARQVSTHPLLGAYHLACVLGPHPALEAALSHHWRQGQGYPWLAAAPPSSIEVVAVASTFAALTQPRPFRSEPFDARGAADVLVSDAAQGAADANTVRLLVHALRGAQGDERAVHLGRQRFSHFPAVNRHTVVAPPQRSPA